MSVFVKTGGINGSTEVDLNTRTESLSVTMICKKRKAYIRTKHYLQNKYSNYNLRKTEDTRVGDLGLNEGRGIQLELGTNFEGNGVRTLGIPSSLTGSFEIAVDAVVVRGSIVAQVVGGMDSNTIFSSGITDSSVVTTDLFRKRNIFK